MTDLSDNTGSSELQVLLADAAVEAMDDSARAEAVCVPVEELKKAAGEIKADFSKREQKIHRFPASLRPLGELYIRPMCVAIGPYHRGLPQVQETEKAKRAAAYHFTRASGRTVEEMHAAIRSVVDEARSCYADAATAGIEDPEFVAMMFHDACFLLEFINMVVDADADPSLLNFFRSEYACIFRDIMLLENQLPWLVVKILMRFKSVPLEMFLVYFRRMFQIEVNLVIPVDLDSIYEPPHLLGLFRSSLIGGNTNQIFPVRGSYPSALSATNLEEIGISLTASKTSKFMDIDIKKGYLFGKLFLSPLLLNVASACWLINMAVFEHCIDSDAQIGSYLCLLAMLMDREEDVYELRRKSLLQADFSDKEALQFFKSLVKYVSFGTSYIHIMTEIEAYRKNRWICIKLHKFIYNNFKSIVTVLSMIGVLTGIFKTLLSIKQHQ